jgi:hypothetical protein
MSTAQARPPIPEPMMRQIRQRCGFGCIICGMPLYQYHHMLGWAETKQHVAEEITLLCDLHHREVTNRLLPPPDVAAANQNPYNLRVGVSPVYPLHFRGGSCTINVGSNIFALQPGRGTLTVPLMIDNVPLIGFWILDGHLLLRATIFDECNRLILRIWDNELQYKPVPWDIEFVGTRLILREAARHILVDMEFCPPNHVTVSRARLMLNGVEVLVRPDSVTVASPVRQQVIRGCINLAAGGGIVIGPDRSPVGAVFYEAEYPRYGNSNTASREWVRDVFSLPLGKPAAPGDPAEG